MSDRYAVVFQGEIQDGQDAEAVQQKVGALFKADAAKTQALFSGKRITIKKGVDEATAQKFVNALAKAGAIAYAQNMDAPAPEPKVETVEAAPPPAAESAPNSAPTAAPTAQEGAPQTVVDIQPQSSPDDLSLRDSGGFLVEPEDHSGDPPAPDAIDADLAAEGSTIPAPPKDETPPPEPGDWSLSEVEQGKASFSLDP
ncbi:conserved hypothetical protein [gamma proteobacterium HTCC5015]|nr:conserved hypothetical protein [gamma proteobacterium HTCC5015]